MNSGPSDRLSCQPLAGKEGQLQGKPQVTGKAKEPSEKSSRCFKAQLSSSPCVYIMSLNCSHLVGN